jgi:transcriptional antiterminator NusG
MAEEAKWYVVHTYSGYENAVAAAILKAAENRKMQDLIEQVNIPMETVTEHTDNGDKTVERKTYPGYVFVRMIMTDESWHLVRNVRGVTGFVGSANKAVPLTEEEIQSLGIEKHEIIVGYEIGSTVKVTDGPLVGFLGTVDEIETDKSRVRVIVSMFGRETPVDLDFEGRGRQITTQIYFKPFCRQKRPASGRKACYRSSR